MKFSIKSHARTTGQRGIEGMSKFHAVRCEPSKVHIWGMPVRPYVLMSKQGP